MTSLRKKEREYTLCALFHVGAGLPAMRAARCIRRTVVMLSQASQLPHSIGFHLAFWVSAMSA
ncbi:hypothetical protein E1K68_26975 [Pseudomonas sp. B2021]|nr:hypothetical protein [Pseudomonas sp. B2021]TKK12687.1 hypothetical protein PflCFBP13510_08290 [Pseudomonas fluorescens]